MVTVVGTGAEGPPEAGGGDVTGVGGARGGFGRGAGGGFGRGVTTGTLAPASPG
jgi:hypothetical protein